VPIALFVDLLHFRTVRRAVKSGEWAWKVTAVFTTLLAFGLQWMFYNRPGEGEALLWWQVILFASIVPVGLAIMAWHHQQQEQEQITDWQALIAAAEQRAAQMQEEAAAAHERATQAQQEAAATHERAEKVQREAEAERERASQAQARAVQEQGRLEQVQQEAAAAHEWAEEVQREAEAAHERAEQVQTQLADVQAHAEEVRSRLERVQAEADLLQTKLDQLQAVNKAWQALNPETQTLALFNARLLTAQAAAEELGVHVSTVRRKAKLLNGSQQSL
jgi:chromosome segregation ATPase